MSEKQHHVIIMGAGASASSGFPLANALRLLMSSEKHFRELLEKRVRCNTDYGNKVVQTIWTPMAKTLELFRHGGFATVDEFSYLGGDRFREEVVQLKMLLRFVLAMYSPEDEFENSDYYPFVQRLFHKNLFPLRTDLSILTFNYDGYLPYLLEKASRLRKDITRTEDHTNSGFALSSGFAGRVLGNLRDGNDLCALQLHGSIAWPSVFKGENSFWYGDLFELPARDRIEKLLFTECARTIPPVLFPWEIISREGNIREKKEFCLIENCDNAGRRQGGYSGSYDLHDLFSTMWNRAVKEINRATKVSFVGLSMHEFLNPALSFLFKEKRGAAQVVIVTKEMAHFRAQNDLLFRNPASPAYKLRRIMKNVWAHYDGGLDSDGMIHVLPYDTFDEFIRYELE